MKIYINLLLTVIGTLKAKKRTGDVRLFLLLLF